MGSGVSLEDSSRDYLLKEDSAYTIRWRELIRRGLKHPEERPALIRKETSKALENWLRCNNWNYC